MGCIKGDGHGRGRKERAKGASRIWASLHVRTMPPVWTWQTPPPPALIPIAWWGFLECPPPVPVPSGDGLCASFGIYVWMDVRVDELIDECIFVAGWVDG